MESIVEWNGIGVYVSVNCKRRTPTNYRSAGNKDGVLDG